jgi:dipeptidyl aminopeptidase/acylaminoacyl peptidase
MSRHFFLLLVAATLVLAGTPEAATRVERGGLVFDNIPEPDAKIAERADAYVKGREATPLGWSPKGQLLIATRFGETQQLHVVDKQGGERRQLTFADGAVSWGGFSPDPGREAFAYLQDTGGNGRYQLYYQRMGQPAARQLSDGKSVNGGALWSNSGRQIAFFSTARDGKTYDIDVVDPESGALPRLAIAGDDTGLWSPLDWSPDDRQLLILRTVSAAESHLYVVDIGDGQKRELDPAPAAAAASIGAAKFSRDGQGVYFVSDAGSEFKQLHYVNLFTGEKTALSRHLPWDIEALALSRDGHYLAYASNEAGSSKLNLIDLRAHVDLTPPHLAAKGVISALDFDADSKRLVFGFEAANQPRDAYVVDIATNHLEAWTQSEPGPVDSAKFVTPRLTRFASFDRDEGHNREIPAWIYEPSATGLPGTVRHPVLILLQGGRDGQFRPGFDPWIQYVVGELGFAVVAPNLRGSMGYGKTYAALADGRSREDAVKDIGALLVWLDSQSAFDARRVVVSGSGYGGYLALAALVNFGDRLRGGIDVAGVSDFVEYLGDAAAATQELRRKEYGDERDPDTRAYLRRISPLTNADRISRPLLIVQGKNNPVVPPGQSEQMINRLRSRGAEVWYLLATDEGREIDHEQDKAAYFRVRAQFLAALR